VIGSLLIGHEHLVAEAAVVALVAPVSSLVLKKITTVNYKCILKVTEMIQYVKIR
jgi:hypothetical protein